MNLELIEKQVDDILAKLECSSCSQSMATVYRTESGKLECLSCIKKNQPGDLENNATVDNLRTDINAMFKELKLSLSNGEPLKENTHSTKRRKITRKKPLSKTPKDVIEFFTSGPGASFFKTRIESCLSISSEPANKEAQSGIPADAEPSFQEEKNPLPQDDDHSDSKKIRKAENATHDEETVNGVNDVIETKTETPKKILPSDGSQSSEIDSDTDLFVPATPETKLRQSRTSFMGTALSPKSKLTLQKFARFFSVTVVETLTQDFDCLVVENSAITWKYLYARCKKIPIVNFTWVVDSLEEERFMPLGPYKVDEQDLQIPSFFQDLTLILCPPFSTYSSCDVKAVLEATGAKVCNFEEWQPGLKELRTPRLFVGANDTIPYDHLTLTRMVVKYRAPVVDISYFVPVIKTGKLKNIENHLIIEMSKDDLIYLGFPERLTLRTESDEDDDSS